MYVEKGLFPHRSEAIRAFIDFSQDLMQPFKDFAIPPKTPQASGVIELSDEDIPEARGGFITFRAPSTLKTILKHISRMQGCSSSEVLRKAILFYAMHTLKRE